MWLIRRPHPLGVFVWRVGLGLLALGIGVRAVEPRWWPPPPFYWSQRVLLLGGIMCIVGLLTGFLKRRRFPEGCCVQCGYILRGSPGPKCPECGALFEKPE